MSFVEEFHSDIKKSVHKDIDELLVEFNSRQDLSYTVFTEVWTQKSFSLIYCGIDNGIQLKYYIEEVFHYIQNCFLKEPDYNKQIGCLYAMYGLYYKQPVEDFVKFRFSQDEWKFFLNFKQTLRTKRQMDALYIASKLQQDNAFNFVVFSKIFAPNVKMQQEEEEETDDLEKFHMELNKIFNCKDGIADLEKMCTHYEKTKRDFKDPRGNNIVFFNSALVKDLKNILFTMHSNTKETDTSK